eukprot:TRINITY_DN18500_c0_g1_i1.p1 TRINITY_DN18500_c0_g1~~TRINITY_DN18500_c0_g1_i1.p1  ORF type:complete len:538 (-),score=84.38 TRINITY_DN18500_c0_g1_i1:53-1666(-)
MDQCHLALRQSEPHLLQSVRQVLLQELSAAKTNPSVTDAAGSLPGQVTRPVDEGRLTGRIDGQGVGEKAEEKIQGPNLVEVLDEAEKNQLTEMNVPAGRQPHPDGENELRAARCRVRLGVEGPNEHAALQLHTQTDAENALFSNILDANPVAAESGYKLFASNARTQDLEAVWSAHDKCALGCDTHDNATELRLHSAWLFVWGLSQCKTLWHAVYKCLMSVCLIVVMALSVYSKNTDVGFSRDITDLNGQYLFHTRFTSICGLVVWLSIQVQAFRRHSDLLKMESLMSVESQRLKWADAWKHLSRRADAKTAVIWLVGVTARAVLVCIGIRGSRGALLDVLDVLSFAFMSGLFSASVAYVMNLALMHIAMLDTFCIRAAWDLSCGFNQRRKDWDKVQTLLRRSSEAVAPYFAVLSLMPMFLVTLMALYLLAGNQPQGVLALIPEVPSVLQVMRTTYYMTKVSEGCSRAPIFLNSLLLGEIHDEEASRFITYMEKSRAAFHLFGVKIHAPLLVQGTSVLMVGTGTLLFRGLQAGWINL